MRHTKPSIINVCPAVILAGGLSRRMGYDKASLELGGKSMLRRIVDVLRENFSPIYVSVRSLPADVPEGTLPLPDLHPGCGPLSGLHAALAATDNNVIFLSAVDLPFVRLDAALYLLSQIGLYDACVIRRANSYTEPLFAAYSKACLPIAAAMLEVGEYRMNRLLDRCRVRYIDEQDVLDADRLLTNVNTPQDFREVADKFGDINA